MKRPFVSSKSFWKRLDRLTKWYRFEDGEYDYDNEDEEGELLSGKGFGRRMIVDEGECSRNKEHDDSNNNNNDNDNANVLHSCNFKFTFSPTLRNPPYS